MLSVKEWRQKQFSQKLFVEADRYAKANNLNEILSAVHLDNKAARNAFIKAGYIEWIYILTKSSTQPIDVKPLAPSVYDSVVFRSSIDTDEEFVVTAIREIYALEGEIGRSDPESRAERQQFREANREQRIIVAADKTNNCTKISGKNISINLFVTAIFHSTYCVPLVDTFGRLPFWQKQRSLARRVYVDILSLH